MECHEFLVRDCRYPEPTPEPEPPKVTMLENLANGAVKAAIIFSLLLFTFTMGCR